MPWQALKYLKIGTCPASQKLLAYMEKMLIYIGNHPVSLALQPEALVNTSGRVDYSRPAWSGKNGMVCFVQGDKNSMGCYVRGDKTAWDALSGVA